MTKAEEFRMHAVTAETSARGTSDPEVKLRFLDIARSWRALAEMVDKGKVVEVAKPHGGS